MYTSELDGLNGPGTKRALRNFQTKAGLIPDAVLGPLTKSALEKGEDSYVVVNVSTPTVDTESNSTCIFKKWPFSRSWYASNRDKIIVRFQYLVFTDRSDTQVR